MTPYRQRASVPTEPAPPEPDVEAPTWTVRPPPVVREPGTPLAIWVLLISVTLALLVSQLHTR